MNKFIAMFAMVSVLSLSTLKADPPPVCCDSGNKGKRVSAVSYRVDDTPVNQSIWGTVIYTLGAIFSF